MRLIDFLAFKSSAKFWKGSRDIFHLTQRTIVWNVVTQNNQCVTRLRASDLLLMFDREWELGEKQQYFRSPVTTMLLFFSRSDQKKKQHKNCHAVGFVFFSVSVVCTYMHIAWTTKLPCCTLSPTQHHSFFRKLPPLSLRCPPGCTAFTRELGRA